MPAQHFHAIPAFDRLRVPCWARSWPTTSASAVVPLFRVAVFFSYTHFCRDGTREVDVPPPPLACGFKAGDQALISFLLARASSRRHELGLECAVQVQYFSETKQRWVETLVLRMFELDPAVRWHAVLPRMWLISA